jgi:hypothetical protein
VGAATGFAAAVSLTACAVPASSTAPTVVAAAGGGGAVSLTACVVPAAAPVPAAAGAASAECLPFFRREKRALRPLLTWSTASGAIEEVC